MELNTTQDVAIFLGIVTSLSVCHFPTFQNSPVVTSNSSKKPVYSYHELISHDLASMVQILTKQDISLVTQYIGVYHFYNTCTCIQVIIID